MATSWGCAEQMRREADSRGLSGLTAASFGVAAGVFALFFFSDVPKVRNDILLVRIFSFLCDPNQRPERETERQGEKEGVGERNGEKMKNKLEEKNTVG